MSIFNFLLKPKCQCNSVCHSHLVWKDYLPGGNWDDSNPEWKSSLQVSIIFTVDPGLVSFLKAHEVSLSAPTPHSSTPLSYFNLFLFFLELICSLEEASPQRTSCHYTEGMCAFPFLDTFPNISQNSLLCFLHLSYHQIMDKYGFSNEPGSISLVQWLKVLSDLDIKLLPGILCHLYCIWKSFLTLFNYIQYSSLITKLWPYQNSPCLYLPSFLCFGDNQWCLKADTESC